MNCPTCGAEQPTGAKFCNQCGARLPELLPALPPGACARCGAANPPASKFCAECGAPLSAAPAPVIAASMAQDALPTEAPAPALAPPAIPMLLVSASGAVLRFPPVAGATWLIGRDDPVTGVHPEIDLAPLDPERTVSRRHAQIRLDGDQPRLIAGAATNGTKVNGAVLPVGEALTLVPGDRIEFGRCALTFKVEA